MLCQCKQPKFRQKKQSRIRNKLKQLAPEVLSEMVGSFLIVFWLYIWKLVQIQAFNTPISKAVNYLQRLFFSLVPKLELHAF